MDAETTLRVLRSFALDFHVAVPGIVRSYDFETQTIEVQVALQKVVPGRDPDDDEDQAESLPILTSVPVMFPRGDGFALTFPLSAGDGVLIVFCDSDIGAYRATGSETDPGTDQRHGTAGAVAIPGMFPRAGALASAHASRMRIGKDAGPFIDFPGSTIDVGGASALAIASKCNTEFLAIQTALAGASPPITYTPVVGGVGGTVTRGG